MQSNKNGKTEIVAVIIIVCAIAALVMANKWLQEQTSDLGLDMTPPSEVKTQDVKPEKETARKKRLTGEVIRKTRFSPDRTYEINVFYQEGQEIARNRTANGEAYDQTGEIPDGKVKFFHESNQTYGVAYYYNQKLHGPTKLYYKDGELWKDVDYQHGKLMTCTEYYHDGTVRMEQDYSDARGNTDDPEVGVGKVYFRDGTLKYEWSMTNTEPVGFKKSYNRKGVLVDAVYYDEYGQITQHIQASSDSDTQTETKTPQTTEPPMVNNPPVDPSVPPPPEKPPKQIYIPVN